MSRWYYEQRTSVGRWAPNASDQEPAVKGPNGKRKLRAVTAIPPDHQHLTLHQLAAAYGPDSHLNPQARPAEPEPKATAAPTTLDWGRILRAASHWAGSISDEFAAIAAACGASLLLTEAAGGAVTLTGLTNAGLPVSICLASAEGGTELHLLQTEAITHEGFAAIRTTEIQLPLPRYLARQLAPLEDAA